MRDLVALARPGGRVLVIDYARHDDEKLSEQQADVWMGFSPEELGELGESAGLERVHVAPVPAAYRRTGPDAHLAWLALVGSRKTNGEKAGKRQQPKVGKT
jgi:ArsR family transcriptional regulator